MRQSRNVIHYYLNSYISSAILYNTTHRLVKVDYLPEAVVGIELCPLKLTSKVAEESLT